MSKNIKNTWWALAFVVMGWLVASVIIGALGLFDQPDAPPTYFGLFIGAPLLVFVVAYKFSKRTREGLLALPLWGVVAVHSLRFVGFFFVAGALTKELAPQFGWSAGIGDIIAATVSIPLAISLRRQHYTKWLRARFVAWNIFGLTDLFSAITLGLLYSLSVLGVWSSPELNTQSATHLPLSLIPTFYVPGLILLHFLALSRTREIASNPHKLAKR